MTTKTIEEIQKHFTEDEAKLWFVGQRLRTCRHKYFHGNCSHCVFFKTEILKKRFPPGADQNPGFLICVFVKTPVQDFENARPFAEHVKAKCQDATGLEFDIHQFEDYPDPRSRGISRLSTATKCPRCKGFVQYFGNDLLCRDCGHILSRYDSKLKRWLDVCTCKENIEKCGCPCKICKENKKEVEIMRPVFERSGSQLDRVLGDIL